MVAPTTSAPAAPTRPVSSRKRAANRRNAKSSTGPRTPLGKATSARNATTHGIFCRDLLLPGEDEWMFRWVREGVIRRLRPQDPLELMLVDRIVQAQWRLNRCQAAEHLDHDHQAARLREQGQRAIRRFERRHGTRQDLLDEPQPGDDRLLFELDLLERLAATDITSARGLTLHLSLRGTADRTMERLGGYEQRLERTIHRAMLELRQLRGTPTKTWPDLPPSPYAGRVEVEMPGEEEEDDRDDERADPDGGDATPSPRYAGERAGERGEPRGECNPRPIRGDAPSDDPMPATAGAAPSPCAARPSPQPAPRRTGEREPEQVAPAQNEPTAEISAASIEPAVTSDDASRPPERGAGAPPAHDPTARAPGGPPRDPRR